MKLAIIENSALVRQSLKKLLAELEPIRVVGEADTLPAALELIESSKPEIIVLDIVLKNGSGFEVLKKVKSRANPPLVIILTNHVSLPFRRKAEQEGCDFFFDKSTEFEKVVEVLKQKIPQLMTAVDLPIPSKKKNWNGSKPPGPGCAR